MTLLTGSTPVSALIKPFSGWQNIGCAWAPEMIYDEEHGQIMLYFTLRFKNGLNKLYYTYMNKEFTAMKTPSEIRIWRIKCSSSLRFVD